MENETQKITVNNPTTFIGIGEVTIWDEKEKIYYSNNFPDPYNFNIIFPGTYTVKGNIHKSRNFVRIKNNIILPPPERNETIKTGKIYETINPNKVTVNRLTGDIFVDEEFWNKLPVNFQAFILLHEIGHFYYKTEEKADKYATKLLLNMGENPNSILRAVQETLTNDERIYSNYLSILNEYEKRNIYSLN
jgi:hypothetical protein